MHALLYLWSLGDRFDAEALRRRSEERAPLFDSLPGLLAKSFLIDPEGRRFGGFYLWKDRAAADAFLAGPLFAGAREAMGDPEITRFDAPALAGTAAAAIAVPPRMLSFNHAMIYARDVPRSAAFYERLGFRTVARHAHAYARLVSPAGGTSIAIHLAEEGNAPGPNQGVRLYFEVDALDALCAGLEEEGVAFKQPPQDMPWGWRHAYLDDPDGHEISLYRAGPARLEG